MESSLQFAFSRAKKLSESMVRVIKRSFLTTSFLNINSSFLSVVPPSLTQLLVWNLKQQQQERQRNPIGNSSKLVLQHHPSSSPFPSLYPPYLRIALILIGTDTISRLTTPFTSEPSLEDNIQCHSHLSQYHVHV